MNAEYVTVYAGFDISTTTVGIAFFYDDKLVTTHVSRSKDEELVNFADRVIAEFMLSLLDQSIRKKLKLSLCIEEPAKAYAQGRTSAGTISKLQYFNGMITYGLHKLFAEVYSSYDYKFCHVSVSHGRKKCGYPNIKGSKNKKQDVFDDNLKRYPSKVSDWINKKTEKPYSWAYDESDAVVMAAVAKKTYCK